MGEVSDIKNPSFLKSPQLNFKLSWTYQGDFPHKSLLHEQIYILVL